MDGYEDEDHLMEVNHLWDGFGMSADVFIRLYAEAIAIVLSKGVCRECKSHVVQGKAIKALKEWADNYLEPEQVMSIFLVMGARLENDEPWDALLTVFPQEEIESQNFVTRIENGIRKSIEGEGVFF